jgi:hypothetical protein
VGSSDANLKLKPIIVNFIDINDENSDKDNDNNGNAASSKPSRESKT